LNSELGLTNRRSRLRSATADAHDRLDSIVDAAGFFDDRTLYAVYLQATWRARHPIEMALTRGRAILSLTEVPYRVIAPALCADIFDITGSPPSEEANTAVMSYADTAAQALGIIYVLEGSALGARVLARRASALGMGPDFGARHLAMQMAAPGAWKTFLVMLEAVALDSQQEAACVAGAIETFARFELAYRTPIPALP
jgi:heme oxygenase (biliverdin-IX-beta and delta-forming)